MDAGPRPLATKPFAPLWNGASTCCKATSAACSLGSPHSPGAATTEAIAEVCAGLAGAARDVPRILRHLARASLIVPDAELPERWSMVESVRELAAIELEAVGEDDVLAARHRLWFALRVERVEAEIGLSGRSEVMRDLVADQDNVRRAINTALAAGDGTVALRICTAMAPFWTSHGDWTEGCERLGAVGPAERGTTRDCGGGPSLPWGTSCCSRGPS